MSPTAPGRLVVIGGGEQRDEPGEVLDAFVGSLPDSRRRVAVCGEASREPDDMVALYHGALGSLGCEVVDLDHATLREGRWATALDGAGALFLTGGSQARLMERIGDDTFLRDLRHRWRTGLVIAGTSAGASAMGRCMIESGHSRAKPSDSDIEIGTGLGLLDVVVDQHFAERGRINRLLAAVARTGCLGIGIDEDTALLVDGARFTVVGTGAVTVIDGTETVFHTHRTVDGDELLTAERAVVHVLEPGTRFDIVSRKLLTVAR